MGGHFSDLGNSIHNTFQGLNEVYEAPERELLVSSTVNIQTNLTEFGPSLPAMATHLVTLADGARGWLSMLENVREDAYDWERRMEADPDWQSDQAMVDEMNMLVALVQVIMTDRIPELCFTAANEIVKLHGGKTWDPETGVREGEEPPPPPDDEQTPEEPPWGTPENVDHPWWLDTLQFPGNVVLGVLTVVGETIESVLTLVPGAAAAR